MMQKLQLVQNVTDRMVTVARGLQLSLWIVSYDKYVVIVNCILSEYYWIQILGNKM